MGARFEHWEQASYFEWLEVFKRLPLKSRDKLVGYALASNTTASTGDDAHPGNDLLMLQTGLSDKTIREALDHLRELGLVVRRVSGSSQGRRGYADVYMLALHNEARIAAGRKPCECNTAA